VDPAGAGDPIDEVERPDVAGGGQDHVGARAQVALDGLLRSAELLDGEFRATDAVRSSGTSSTSAATPRDPSSWPASPSSPGP
jgi:hypothetical protein